MPELEELEVTKPLSDLSDDLTPPPRRPVPPGLVLGAIGVLALLAGVGWWWKSSRVEAPALPAPAEAPVPTPVAEPEPLGDPGEAPLVLPALDSSDGVVRELAAALAQHPELARWLALDGLVRRFVVTVVNVAEGVHPRKHFPSLAPGQAFTAREQGEVAYPTQESQARYDPYVELFTAVDPAAAARLYGQLSPLFEEAYRDLGYPQGSFDDKTRAAIRRLVATPVPATAPALRRKVRSWVYLDPALEQLSDPQKLLLRMGPANQRALQAHLRRIATALGVD